VDFAYDADDEAFRAELNQWLDANLPDFMEQGEIGEEHSDLTARTMARRQAWQRRLNEGKWAAINWPIEWGGREATTMQNVIYSETMARQKAPGIYNPNGIWQIGPMIIRWGTDEQKNMWLPHILDASVHWCQGFSEPQAGSDLANLRTVAVRDGDEYVVNGTKIWTSTAHFAKWGLFLVRTDPDAISRGEKHVGITALIIDLELPGVQCNPIREITGESMFDEVVFTDARVPASYLLGGEGDGWNVAMGTLTHERAGTGSIAIGLRAELDAMIALAREHNPDALESPDIRDRIARMYTQVELTRLLNARALSKTLKGERTFPENQIAKLQWSSLSQALAELNIDILGPIGLLEKGGPDALAGGHAAHNYPWQRFTSIGAGATEVQKNIIADRAIHLPRK
jgi:alkylation response protein AidB-like acyl-CoA dehydrogenase